ncbi:MAG: hypothetical protein JSW39_02605 [Desulfobacterales bacterium]|nr:MAG: hypothetical protein JSW39_02605 [Desulfobacterales bacterium]
MTEKRPNYHAVVSSDWNECLAPCGPFDCISFNYPELALDLNKIFGQYTGNLISLGEATRRIRNLLPAPITPAQMDAYLAESFRTYQGVSALIEWCHRNNILFMINTTGMVGYFQRVWARGLLPRVAVVSAHPLIRYPELPSDPPYVLDLAEIQDKSRNTAVAVHTFKIPPAKIILMGDSGGDGPHFEWGKRQGACLIGSMTKPSLEAYCRTRGVEISLHFGRSYSPGEPKDLPKEMQVNFMDLAAAIEEFLSR